MRAPQPVRPAAVPIPPSRPESFMRLSALMNLKGSQEEAKMVDRASLSGKEGGLAPDLWLRTTFCRRCASSRCRLLPVTIRCLQFAVHHSLPSPNFIIACEKDH